MRVAFFNFTRNKRANDLNSPCELRPLFESLALSFSRIGKELKFANQGPADLWVYSVHPPMKVPRSGPIRLLWCAENVGRWERIQKLPIDITHYDASITLELDRSDLHIRMSNWLLRCADFHRGEQCAAYREIRANLPLRWDRAPKATLIARTCEAPHLRTRLLAACQKLGIRVDCPSTVGHNTPSIESQALSKIEFCKRYTFCICPENTHAPGYVTEKLMDAVLAGCIPIYWGNLEAERGLFNEERILFISDPDRTAKRIAELIADPAALRRMFELPRFGKQACSIIDGYFGKLDRLVASLPAHI